MAQLYKDEDLEKIREGLRNLTARRLALQERCLTRAYRVEQAKEFATHGFARRLATLARCINNVFGELPPDFEGIPSDEITHDISIQLQAYLINVFGCLDNLAWVWVLDRPLKRQNGSDLPAEWVGLRPPNTYVRESFSAELQAYLGGLAPWFAYLEDYRHALAHQIPLYIPPYAIAPQNEQKYHELEAGITRAILRADYESADARRRERDTLKFFRPVAVHSWSRARPLGFHPQMVADFKTIEEIAGKVLNELDAHSRNVADVPDAMLP